MINNVTSLIFVPGEIMERERSYDRVEPLVKHSTNPVMIADRPWEGDTVYWPTFLYSERDKLFKMWYGVTDMNMSNQSEEAGLIDNWSVHGRFYICYAYSPDGINWIKPAVGKHKQTQYPGNNIVWTDSGYLAGCAAVIEDVEDSDPERIYKMLVYDHNGKGQDGIRTAVSANGIDWNFVGTFPVLPSQDTPSLWYDKRRQRYVVFLKNRLNNVRARMITFSSDFENWSEPALCLAPDGMDPYTMNFYAQSAFMHGGHDFGFLSCYEMSTQLADMELITAPQGIDWTRLPTRPKVLRTGDPGSWDGGGVYPGLGEPVAHGDECWVYYYGTSERHDQSPFLTLQNENRVSGAIGMAKFKAGRLVGQQFEGEGWFASKPFKCPGGELTLDAAAGNPIRVEIRRTGYSSTVQHYSKDDCIPVTGDKPNHKLVWKNKGNLDELAGEFISIRIYGKNSIVYGVKFTRDSSMI